VNGGDGLQVGHLGQQRAVTARQDTDAGIRCSARLHVPMIDGDPAS
jgi:hypothetical protein